MAATTVHPIGYAHTEEKSIPRHWRVSTVTGTLVIDRQYLAGLKDIKVGQQLVVLFLFHQSPQFTPNHLCQKPPHLKDKMGVFSICSPIRPNPIGMSVLTVLGIHENILSVKGMDMLDNTPILDIKPYR